MISSLTIFSLPKIPEALVFSRVRVRLRIPVFWFCRPEPVDALSPYRVPLEKRSLRAYVSILYSDPRMKVYLQGRKVQTKRLLATLHSARKYNFASKTFRTRAEADLAKAKNDVKIGKSASAKFSLFYLSCR